MRNKLITFVSGLFLSAPCVLLTLPNAAAEDLVDIYQQALENDATLDATKYDHEATLELESQARATLLPQINLSANTALHDIENDRRGGFDSQGYSLSLTQALFNKPAFAAVNQVDLAIKQSQTALESAEQNLIIRVSEAYFNILSALDNLDFARSENKAISRQLEQAEKRFEVGLTAVTDVKEALARYDLSVAQVIAADNRLSQAQEALKIITNQDYNDLKILRSEIKFLPPEPANIDHWVSVAEKNNRQYLAAQYSAETAIEEVKLQQSFHYPTLSLIGSHSDTSSDSPLVDSRRSALMLQLDVALFSGGSTSSKVRQAKASQRASKRNLEAQRRAVVQLTRNAYLGVTADISRVKALKQALVSTQAGADATQAGFDVGTRTAIDVLIALRETFRAKADYSTARYAYIINSLRLKQGAGTLNVSDLKKINNWLE